MASYVLHHAASRFCFARSSECCLPHLALFQSPVLVHCPLHSPYTSHNRLVVHLPCRSTPRRQPQLLNHAQGWAAPSHRRDMLTASSVASVVVSSAASRLVCVASVCLCGVCICLGSRASARFRCVQFRSRSSRWQFFFLVLTCRQWLRVNPRSALARKGKAPLPQSLFLGSPQIHSGQPHHTETSTRTDSSRGCSDG